MALGIAVEVLSHTVGPKAQLRAQNPLNDHGYTWTERKEKCPDLGEFLDSGIRESDTGRKSGNTGQKTPEGYAKLWDTQGGPCGLMPSFFPSPWLDDQVGECSLRHQNLSLPILQHLWRPFLKCPHCLRCCAEAFWGSWLFPSLWDKKAASQNDINVFSIGSSFCIFLWTHELIFPPSGLFIILLLL